MRREIMKKFVLGLSLVLAIFATASLASRDARALDTVVVGQPYYGGGYYGGYGPYTPYAGYVGYPGPYAGFVPGYYPPVAGPGYLNPNPAFQQPINSAGSPFYLINQIQRTQNGQRPYFPANPAADTYY